MPEAVLTSPASLPVGRTGTSPGTCPLAHGTNNAGAHPASGSCLGACRTSRCHHRSRLPAVLRALGLAVRRALQGSTSPHGLAGVCRTSCLRTSLAQARDAGTSLRHLLEHRRSVEGRSRRSRPPNSMLDASRLVLASGITIRGLTASQPATRGSDGTFAASGTPSAPVARRHGSRPAARSRLGTGTTRPALASSRALAYAAATGTSRPSAAARTASTAPVLAAGTASARRLGSVPGSTGTTARSAAGTSSEGQGPTRTAMAPGPAAPRRPTSTAASSPTAPGRPAVRPRTVR